ncbi:hypothetical protein ACQPZJ_02940 [Actinoplanes sp. CA-054009]
MLGNDQSPLSGQAAAITTARHGRSSSTTSLIASLRAYATTVPATVSTIPVIVRASRRRSARHPIPASSRPRSTRVPSVATSSTGPSHDGAPATAPVIARYADTETPLVTYTGSADPSPPGASQAITAAADTRTPSAFRFMSRP